ncbi:Lar family restriction alleviation protein [Citrobacter sedlakii]|nr:Lar family restriction alleviation protein [Citrobacter sedlakii]MDR5006637.1 Lar family restriction alleviation protein [Citrobacter sedlakii]
MPCPFCGGKAHQLTIEQDDDPHFGGDVITCTECGASSHVEFGFKENLKSAWNSRAAMLHGAGPVSNSDELPLDYLQGQKDGLEWAAQLAEANHPQTGDWLYDDPIDLARAIRKGPDMPTAQAANSPVITDGWMAEAERLAQLHGVSFVIFRQGEIPVCADPTKFWFGYDLAAPRPEVKKRTNAEKATMGARLTNHRFKI